MSEMVKNSAFVEARPLVTFALFAYNQEDFIREAVEGALRQTYQPLEIILSDDCSTDKTASIINEVIQYYQGPHKVIINVNETNLGIAGHFNKVMNMLAGEFVVMAAGDDISHAERTAILVNEWEDAGRPPAVCSDFEIINGMGQPIQQAEIVSVKFLPHTGESRTESLTRLIRERNPSLIGCTEAWRKDLITKFPDLLSDVWYEDKAYSFRAMLLGEIHFVPKILVQYRRHSNNVTKTENFPILSIAHVFADEERTSLALIRLLAVLNNHRSDLQHLFHSGLLSKAQYEKFEQLIKSEIEEFQLKISWWQLPYSTKFKCTITHIALRPLVKRTTWLMIRLLPFRLYAMVRIIRQTINQFAISNRVMICKKIIR